MASGPGIGGRSRTKQLGEELGLFEAYAEVRLFTCVCPYMCVVRGVRLQSRPGGAQVVIEKPESHSYFLSSFRKVKIWKYSELSSKEVEILNKKSNKKNQTRIRNVLNTNSYRLAL